MSSGQFTRAFYTDDDGDVHPILLQPETLEAQFGATANAAPAGPATSDVSARVTGSRRGKGLFARYVTIAWTGDPPDEYAPAQNLKIAVPSATVWNAITKYSACTYLGTAAQVVSKTAEKQN